MGLIEVMLAMGIAAVASVAMISLLIRSSRASLQSELMIRATEVAARELDYVRALRDTYSWTEFVKIVNGDDAAKGANCVPASVGGTAMCHVDTTSGHSVGKVVGYVNTTGSPPTPRDLKWFFYVTESDGSIAVTESSTSLRVHVQVEWTIGKENQYTHIYTDLSNWRGN